MINTENIGGLIGATVIGSDGDKIGTVGQVYVDPDTGRANWITVRTGLFGMRESFVPLDAAEQTGDEIRVPYSKEFVKDAPNIDHEGALEEDETDNLYSYYGGASAGYSTGTTGGYRTGDDTPGTAGYTAAATGPAGTGATTGTPGTTGTGGVSGAAGTSGTDDYDTGRRTEGYDTSGPTTDDAMTRSEERLHVGTEKVQTGRARLRKYVVTEKQNVTVPVSREEVRLEREPITDANVGDAHERSRHQRGGARGRPDRGAPGRGEGDRPGRARSPRQGDRHRHEGSAPRSARKRSNWRTTPRRAAASGDSRGAMSPRHERCRAA